MKAWSCILKQPSLSVTSAVSRDIKRFITAAVDVSKHIIASGSYTFSVANETLFPNWQKEPW
jgi:hypothetical protein